jgi:hypothetical protein
MASSRKKDKLKAKSRPAAKKPAAPHKPPAGAKTAPPGKPAVKKGPEKPSGKAAGPAPAQAEATKPAAGKLVAGKPVPGKPAGAKPASGKPAGRKGGRRSLQQRRGPGGELLAVGEILLPNGPLGAEEIQYFFRGCSAAEHPGGEAGVAEILGKRTAVPGATIDADADRADLGKVRHAMEQRFERTIEPLLPSRPQSNRRTFQSVQDRARLRRREIGAFLRGLDIGRTESSHMDSHGEASLQTLMEWAARLENLAEADEPDQADYAQFHRGLDQLENTTEALIVDVEATLRRLRDRIKAS